MSAGGGPAGFGAAVTGTGMASLLLSSARVKPLVEGILTVSNVRVEVSNAGDVAALVVEVVCVRVADTGDAAAAVSGLAVLESNSVLKPLRVASLLGV
jgi:hypothetical protein